MLSEMLISVRNKNMYSRAGISSTLETFDTKKKLGRMLQGTKVLCDLTAAVKK